jgi:hypothetical protein
MNNTKTLRIGISNAPARPDDQTATHQDGISATARSLQRCHSDRRATHPGARLALAAASISGLTLVR